MSETDTPRTDEFYWRETGSNPVGRPVTEWADFARTLERELAAMTASARWYKDEAEGGKG